MIARLFISELSGFYARPFRWGALLAVSLLVLMGLTQLNLDLNKVRVLILNDESVEKEAAEIQEMVKELSDVEVIDANRKGDFVQAADIHRADIILKPWAQPRGDPDTKASHRWQATIRSQSIVDHRRLARAGFAIATIINRHTPWDAIVGSDLMMAKDYGTTICQVGARMCSVYKSVGHPKAAALCSDLAQRRPKDASATKTASCSEERGAVLNWAIAFDNAIHDFCKSKQISEHQLVGICKDLPGSSNLSALVGLTPDPPDHTRAFIPRTICLLVMFIAFVVGSRSVVGETKNNVLHILIAASKGRLLSILGIKALNAVLFSMLAFMTMVVFSALYFGISIKPGFTFVAMLVGVGALTSAILGIVAALVFKDEASSYVAGSVYLLFLFIFSGYIVEIRDDNPIIVIISYLSPLKHLIAPVTAWMNFGVEAQLKSGASVNLVAQGLGSIAILLLSAEFYRRSA